MIVISTKYFGCKLSAYFLINHIILLICQLARYFWHIIYCDIKKRRPSVWSVNCKMFRTVAEAFGVNKDHVQNLVKRKAQVLEEYRGNAPSHSRCFRRKTDNDKINELLWTYRIWCHIKNKFVTEANQNKRLFYVIRSLCMYTLTIRYTHMNINK